MVFLEAGFVRLYSTQTKLLKLLIYRKKKQAADTTGAQIAIA